MLPELHDFYFKKEEPAQSCLLALRDIILGFDKDINETWKYKMPFFYYKGKMFCYLWVHKKNKLPYIGIVEGGKIDHPGLVTEDRARMKIMFINPEENLKVGEIEEVLGMAIAFYK